MMMKDNFTFLQWYCSWFYTEGNKGKEGTDKNFGLIFKDYCISILSVLTYVPRGTEKKNHDK